MKKQLSKKTLRSEIQPVDEITLKTLEKVIEDSQYLEEDRQMVKEALKVSDPEELQRVRIGVWIGDRFDEMGKILTASNGNHPNQDYPRRLMRAIATQIELNKEDESIDRNQVIIDEMKPEGVADYFNKLSDPRGRKPYLLLYYNLPVQDLPVYLAFEMLDNIEDQDQFVVDKVKESFSQLSANLLLTHLNNRPAFLGRLIANGWITEDELVVFCQRSAALSGRVSQPYITLNHLLFDKDRNKVIQKGIMRNGSFFPNQKMIKQVRKIDRQFFDGLQLRSK